MSGKLNAENIRLIELYKNSSDKKTKEVILKKIFRINEPFVYNFIKGYPVDIQEDLKQECMIALYKAVEDFDLSYDNNFVTYAKWKIMDETRNSKVKQSHTNTSIYAKRVLSAYNKYEDKDKDIDVIAKDLNTSPDTLKKALLSQNPMCQLNESIVDDRYNEEDDFILRDRIKQVIDLLSDKEKLVVMHYFGFGTDSKTMSQIGRFMTPAISRQRVNYIYKNAMTKIKKYLLNGGIND